MLARLVVSAQLLVGVVGFSRPGAILLHDTVEAAAAQRSTSLNDQAELNVTVYNSDVALVRDVRNSSPERHVRPELHGHRSDRQSRVRPFPVAQRAGAHQRAGAELRIRPAGA